MGTSPADNKSLAPVDVREHSGWLSYIHGAFLRKYTGSLAQTRGVFANRALSVGRIPIDQRKGATVAKMGTRSRGSMSAVPTPQALIKQVTGIGVNPQGR